MEHKEENSGKRKDSNFQNEDLDAVYGAYGSDSDKYRFAVLAVRKCSAVRRGCGFRALEAIQRLAQGAKCPVEGEFFEVMTPHPAPNVSGALAAKECSGKCPLCGMEPDKYDFEVR
jgi:hypothetical protein